MTPDPRPVQSSDAIKALVVFEEITRLNMPPSDTDPADLAGSPLGDHFP